jgi:hypothetical protein
MSAWAAFDQLDVAGSYPLSPDVEHGVGVVDDVQHALDQGQRLGRPIRARLGAAAAHDQRSGSEIAASVARKQERCAPGRSERRRRLSPDRSRGGVRDVGFAAGDSMA